MLKRDPPPAQRRGVAEDEFLQHGGTEGGKLGAGTEIENKFDCGDVKAAIDCMTTSLDACLFKTPSHFGVFHHRLSLCRYELLVLEAHFEQHIKEGAEGVGWAQEQKNTQEEKILRSVCDKASSLLSLFPGVESVWEFFAALVPLRLLLPLRASVKAREKAKSQSSGEVCYTVCVAREDGHLWKRFAEIAKETAELVQRCFGDDTRATTQSMQRVASVADARGGEGEEGRASRETRSRDFCSRIVVSVLETFEDICEQIGGVPLEFSSSGVGGRPSGGWEGGGGAERPRADHTCKRSGQNSTEGLESSDAQETVAAAELRETVDGLAAFLKLGPRVEESQILS
uniref:Uncharacterized protein n=1 Tax=Chromera velia CCMP2878 TaxID=1169474 RepID=A0A0G4HHX4_9ALVE|eukprot:Cvel_27644.t1-p1 / transcript=Cvel_27644.t1 / gene=Cvel_27644 / organism=Chromera_velia_CCMP2878 / gene_product=hypothetical protein / transcript_product=hypothetical protein / location=Cvel_scaffold3480:12818-13843(-) / protein_length=342 / sequence_SO=supercontig / SO=protein_coding / is_pseudo=false